MPAYTYYLIKTAGVNPMTGEQLYWTYDTDEKGNIINERITNNSAEANNTKYYMGSREPVLQGSFGSNFQLGQFDLSFLTTFSIGGSTYNGVYAGAMEAQYIGDTWHRHSLRAWQQPGDVTDVPKLLVGSGRPTNTDRYLIDASYFSIKSVQFGWTMPSRWTEKANIKSIRLFVVGDNLAMFTHLDGMDPQYSFSGGQSYTYLPTRSVSVGIDINF